MNPSTFGANKMLAVPSFIRCYLEPLLCPSSSIPVSERYRCFNPRSWMYIAYWNLSLCTHPKTKVPPISEHHTRFQLFQTYFLCGNSNTILILHLFFGILCCTVGTSLQFNHRRRRRRRRRNEINAICCVFFHTLSG